MASPVIPPPPDYQAAPSIPPPPDHQPGEIRAAKDFDARVYERAGIPTTVEGWRKHWIRGPLGVLGMPFSALGETAATLGEKVGIKRPVSREIRPDVGDLVEYGTALSPIFRLSPALKHLTPQSAPIPTRSLEQSTKDAQKALRAVTKPPQAPPTPQEPPPPPPPPPPPRPEVPEPFQGLIEQAPTKDEAADAKRLYDQLTKEMKGDLAKQEPPARIAPEGRPAPPSENVSAYQGALDRYTALANEHQKKGLGAAESPALKAAERALMKAERGLSDEELRQMGMSRSTPSRAAVSDKKRSYGPSPAPKPLPSEVSPVLQKGKKGAISEPVPTSGFRHPLAPLPEEPTPSAAANWTAKDAASSLPPGRANDLLAQGYAWGIEGRTGAPPGLSDVEWRQFSQGHILGTQADTSQLRRLDLMDRMQVYRDELIADRKKGLALSKRIESKMADRSPKFETTPEGPQALIEGTPDPALKLASQESSVFKDRPKVERAAAMEKAQETIPTSGPARPFEATMYRGEGAPKAMIYAPDVLSAGGGPILGPGRYYAFTEKQASKYGDKISTAKIALKNPLVLDSNKSWLDLLKAAKAEHLDTSGSLRYKDPEGLPGASERVQAWLKAQGHDGVVVRIPERGDVNARGESIKRLREAFGHDQVVVFDQPKASTLAAPAEIAKRRPFGQFKGWEHGQPNLSDPGDLWRVVKGEYKGLKLSEQDLKSGEWGDIPSWSKGKNGIAPDALAETLADQYPGLGTRAEILQTLKDNLRGWGTLKANKQLRAQSEKAGLKEAAAKSAADPLVTEVKTATPPHDVLIDVADWTVMPAEQRRQAILFWRGKVGLALFAQMMALKKVQPEGSQR